MKERENELVNCTGFTPEFWEGWSVFCDDTLYRVTSNEKRTVLVRRRPDRTFSFCGLSRGFPTEREFADEMVALEFANSYAEKHGGWAK